MGFVVGDPFMVEKGIPYRIRVISQPGQAYGGAVWGDQPVVAVEDRGFNLLQGVSEGTVSIHLADEVDEGPSLLRSKGGVGDTVPIVNGVAIFDGLYINDSRYSYTLNFTTSLDLPGTSVCNSVTFSVSVGLPHKIFLEKDPSQSIVYGGRAFSLQPRIKVIDAVAISSLTTIHLLSVCRFIAIRLKGLCHRFMESWLRFLEGWRSLKICPLIGLGWGIS